jgi:hypothetical protein
VSPHAGQHAVLIFTATFGGIAIWFAGFIALMRWRDDMGYVEGRFWGAIILIPVTIFLVFVLSFWE